MPLTHVVEPVPAESANLALSSVECTHESFDTSRDLHQVIFKITRVIREGAAGAAIDANGFTVHVPVGIVK